MTHSEFITVLDWARQPDAVRAHLLRPAPGAADAEAAAARIIEAVRTRGDHALSEFTARFDGVQIPPDGFRVDPDALRAACSSLPAPLRRAIRLAARRIRAFHKRQKPRNWNISEANGSRLTQRFLPVNRAAVYVPGGRAPLLSSVLMGVIPAQVAGVPEIVLASPPGPDGQPHGGILAAAHLLGVGEVWRVGGAQAIAALALGTRSIRPVDVIVGPGNQFVAAAKKLLFGSVGIESVAGPTDVTIVADDSADPAWVAADMLAQAEHDPDATALAILIGGAGLNAIVAELKAQTAAAPRRSIIEQSLARNGALICVPGPDEAVQLVNLRAPEHLQVITRNPRPLAERMTGAAAVFIGPWSAEAIGDYVAGPNHTLPTGRTARFASPLSVMHFMRAQHLVQMSREGTLAVGEAAATLAEAEQLFAHAASIRRRMDRRT
ncbi:MAG: histidinol dehydrogenase [Candidatus Sumerlaeia bacterium]